MLVYQRVSLHDPCVTMVTMYHRRPVPSPRYQEKPAGTTASHVWTVRGGWLHKWSCQENEMYKLCNIYIYMYVHIYIYVYIYYYMIQYVENKMNEQGKIRKVLSWCKSGSKHGKGFFHWLLHRNSCWPAVPNPLYWQYSPSNIKQPRVEAVSRVPQKQAKKQHVC